MSAGGTGGVGGRREKTTALADECDSRCGAGAATLTDEELEGGTGGTGSLSAHTGGPISSHSRASLCTRFAICLAQKSPPRRSRNPSRRRVLGSAGSSRHTANRRGGRSACITESRRSKGGLVWNLRCQTGNRAAVAGMARSVAALGPAGACNHRRPFVTTRSTGNPPALSRPQRQ